MIRGADKNVIARVFIVVLYVKIERERDKEREREGGRKGGMNVGHTQQLRVALKIFGQSYGIMVQYMKYDHVTKFCMVN